MYVCIYDYIYHIYCYCPSFCFKTLLALRRINKTWESHTEDDSECKQTSCDSNIDSPWYLITYWDLKFCQHY